MANCEIKQSKNHLRLNLFSSNHPFYMETEIRENLN